MLLYQQHIELKQNAAYKATARPKKAGYAERISRAEKRRMAR